MSGSCCLSFPNNFTEIITLSVFLAPFVQTNMSLLCVATAILFWQANFLAPNGFNLPVSIVGYCKEIVMKGNSDNVNTCCKKLVKILFLF